MEEEKIEKLIQIHDKYIEALEQQNEKLRDMLTEAQEEIDELKKKVEDLKTPVFNPSITANPPKPRNPTPTPNTGWPNTIPGTWIRQSGSSDVATWRNQTCSSPTISADELLEHQKHLLKESEKFAENYYKRKEDG